MSDFEWGIGNCGGVFGDFDGKGRGEVGEDRMIWHGLESSREK